MNRFLTVALFALILTLTSAGRGAGAGPGSPSKATAARGSIKGIVVGPDGQPVANALVAAVFEQPASDEGSTRASALARTSRKGEFTLSNLPPGRYSATATSANFAAAYLAGIAVSGDGRTPPVRLRMEPTGITFTGVVRCDGEVQGRGPRVEIRAVRYSDFLGDVFYAEPDPSGRYRITLPKANYLVQVVAEGYDVESRNMMAGVDATLDVQLLRTSPPGPAPAVVVEWIRQHAVPLRTVEAGNGFSDMEPLRDVVGGAHLVTLGEATHGTREFFQLKHRMLEFLVERMGFTVFGIEATMPEGFDVNDYVLTGKGDPTKALSALYFWTWNTQEVLAMIRWMRAYNADPGHARKLKFYGFDMQSSPRAVKVVLAYLRRVDPKVASRMAGVLAPLTDPFLQSNQGLQTLSVDDPIAKAAAEILSRFDEDKAKYVAASSIDEWALARQHARILSQNVELRGGDPFARDRAMAENIRWILEREGPGAKMVAWAHNGHVSADMGPGSNGMGHYLREALGADMVVFGFAFHRGSFQASQMPFSKPGWVHPFTVGPAPEGTLDETLHRAGHSVLALDLRSAPPRGPVADWFRSRHPLRYVGAGFSDSLASMFFIPVAAPRHFDALLFVDRTMSAIPNETPNPPPTDVAPRAGNLDFENDKDGALPSSWTVPPVSKGVAYQVEVSGNQPVSGRHCVRVRSVEGKRYGERWGSLSQRIDATPYRGKKARLRAQVRVDGKSPDAGGRLWMRARPGAGKDPEVIYDGIVNGAITSGRWREYEVAGVVPAEATSIDLGFAFTGDGTAWLDSVSIDSVAP
jgi:erythromycin esterase